MTCGSKACVDFPKIEFLLEPAGSTTYPLSVDSVLQLVVISHSLKRKFSSACKKTMGNCPPVSTIMRFMSWSLRMS